MAAGRAVARPGLFHLSRGVRNASRNPSRNLFPVAKLHNRVAADRAAKKPSLNRMATSLPSVSAREGAQRVQRAAQLCQDMKANDVVLLDLKGVTDMTDYFVIASGTSDTHVRSLASMWSRDEESGLAVHHTEVCNRVAGLLLDFFDFVFTYSIPTPVVLPDRAMWSVRKRGAGTTGVM